MFSSALNTYLKETSDHVSQLFSDNGLNHAKRLTDIQFKSISDLKQDIKPFAANDSFSSLIISKLNLFFYLFMRLKYLLILALSLSLTCCSLFKEVKPDMLDSNLTLDQSSWMKINKKLKKKYQKLSSKTFDIENVLALEQMYLGLSDEDLKQAMEEFNLMV